MTEAEILRAIEGKEPALQRAYLDRVRSVTDAAVVAEIERYINEQDEDSIVSVLSLGLLAVFLEQLRSTYLAGATLEIKFFPGRPVPEFDPVGLGPSTWLSEHARALQRDIDDATRLAVRHTIQMADLLGRPPRATALDIVGRRSPQTGQRTGGITGLSGNYAQAVANARAQLLSGDPAQMRQYLTRIRRDRRFDRLVERAVEARRPIPSADVDRIVGRYSERLLRTRAEQIAATEAHDAFSAGRDQVYEQLVANGLERSRVLKTWHNVGDNLVRHTHSPMQGQRQQLGSPFVTGGGALLMFPGDQTLGAGDNETAGCRCWVEYEIGGVRA
ncbi:hypothetical protein IPC733_05385 [Pseudomonas aeruginosa]|uniref:hypothetical protein n=1 Tax=Pseudomonas TaxID=286 RepID=UPI00070AABF2|nr:MULTISPECIES: hypothetical protein [Pseudomonas]ELY3880247.1 hypothetical protein [Pseudomonas aeruginosa]KSH17439.1 hypothetical protein AO964_04015 [Pseudomonas aeruginosa]MBA4944284.1 hypothetical protein [Pseudomonas aeruginosa]MBI8223088.1 hypothetical protein [Pseudomonas aeruginosa]MCO2873081.1 hypothetical protein [Pseudomonas aeruginosa]